MLQSLTYEDLVLRAQGGDAAAYEEIVRRFQNAAFQYAFSMVGDYGLAEDVQQEAFTTAYCSLLSLKRPAAFPAWFKRIVHSQCLRVRSGSKILTVPLEKAREVADRKPTPPMQMESKETAEAVHKALEMLSPRDGEILRLYYLQDLSSQEISARLGISVKAIRSRLHAARQRLKQRTIEMAKDSIQKDTPAKKALLAKEASAEAINLFDAELKQLVQSPSPEQTRIIDIVCAKGRLLRFSGRMDEALASFQEAMSWPAAKAAPHFEARLRAEMGLTYIRKSNYSQAKTELDFSRKILRNGHRAALLASDIYTGLGVCAWEEGNYQQAREFYEQALQACREAKHPVAEADILENIALLDWKTGRLDEALKRFRLGFRQWAKTQDIYRQAESLMHIGIITEALGHYARAQKHYSEALQLAKSVKYVYLESHIHVNLANLALNQRKWQDAEKHSRAALEIAEGMKDQRAKSIAYENLALAQIGRRDFARAAQSIQKAKQIAASIGDGERLIDMELVDFERRIAMKPEKDLPAELEIMRQTAVSKGYLAALPWILRLKTAAEIQQKNIWAAGKSLESGLKECARQKNIPEERKLKQLALALKSLTAQMRKAKREERGGGTKGGTPGSGPKGGAQ